MIKTHRPRGHIWTCASLFQQTEQFRNIKYEECVSSQAEILLPDPDDDLTTPERAAKRRRIEKLADDFLNGRPLLISSARPSEACLKNVIQWNERSRTSRKFRLPEPEPVISDNKLWKDVDDDWALLRKFVKEANPAAATQLHRSRDSVVVKEQAQASCGPAKRPKPVRLTSEPSTIALKQAAALRARNLKKSCAADPPEAAGRSSLQSLPTDLSLDSALILRPQLRSKPETARSEWLLRRNTTLHTLSVDESADELRCSRDDTPSRIPRSVTPSMFMKPVDEPIELLPSKAPGQDASLVRAPISQDELRLSFRTPRHHRSIQGNDFQDHPPTSSGTHCGTPTPQRVGFYRADTQHASTSFCEPPADPPAPVQPHTQTEPPNQLVKLAASMHDESDQGNVGEHDAKETINAYPMTPPRPSRCGPDASREGADPSAAPTVRSHRHNTRSLTTYKTVQPTQKDTTPFMYRPRDVANKRGKDQSAPASLLAANSKTPAESAKTVREAPLPEQQLIETHPPVLDMTFSHDSSFAPGLNMALVDEHLNSKLPADPASAGRTSALKKALRREMRKSGAEISLPPGEQLSSQPGEHSISDSPKSAEIRPTRVEVAEAWGTVKKSSIQPQWPGTQLLLEKAEHDLFHSQGESHSAADDSSRTIIPRQMDISPSGTETSFKMHTQEEQIPSTQAVLDAWSPWSTVKRPVIVQRAPRSTTPDSRVSTRRLETARTTLETQSSTSFNERAACRRSSLRFSTTSMNSPANTSQLQFSITKRQPPSDSLAKSFGSGPTPKSILRQVDTNLDVRMPASSAPLPWYATTLTPSGLNVAATQPVSAVGTKVRTPSLQVAQLIREDSDPFRTMDEITDYVMGDQEMNGVLSQVAE